MDDLDRSHQRYMQDPEYAAEYERLEPVYDIISAITMARAEQNLTQRELAERCGMRQSAFARLAQLCRVRQLPQGVLINL